MVDKITVDNYRRDEYDIETVSGPNGKVQVITFGFSVTKYDYVGGSFPDAVTEVYTYKTGGPSGTTVATITVVYTDGTKENLSSATKV